MSSGEVTPTFGAVRFRLLVPAVLVGVIAGLVSIGRLWLFDRSAPTEVLWAEDGLFPLCIRKADFFSCLTDPFAGYLLFLPRVLAWPVAVLPWEYWAVASNLIAATLAGLVAAFAFAIIKRAGFSWFSSVVIALLPVISPIVGLEAINAIGSSYMLLLFLSTLMVVLPPVSGLSDRSRGYVVAGTLLLLVTSLTIPSSIVLLALLAFMWLRGRWSRLACGAWTGALVVGFGLQAAVAFTTTEPRRVAVSVDTVQSWADGTLVALLTYLPGLSVGEYSFFFNFTYSPSPWLEWILVLFLCVVGLVLAFRGTSTEMSVGLLLIAGLLFGMIPSVLAGAGNRYFVVPLVLWGTAGLLALDIRIRKSRLWQLATLSLVLAVIWWPAVPASSFRASPAPEWTLEVERITTECRSDPAIITQATFSHFWPPGQGEVMLEPTTAILPCTTVWRWLD